MLYNWLFQKLEKFVSFFEGKKQEVKPCSHSWIEHIGIFGSWGGGKYLAHCCWCYKTITKREDIHVEGYSDSSQFQTYQTNRRNNE